MTNERTVKTMADKLISANALLKYSKSHDFYFTIKGYIDSVAPVDAVPVVRCIKCNFFDYIVGDFGWCREYKCNKLKDGFCSRAVRKKGGEQ